ncbi:DUF371 domain-containing protein [Candidatus Bathyarchaeota archaeon]|nr:MAG: DUF371 domain-containing protein [Candidatus Bathyarchaeota archaeon]
MNNEAAEIITAYGHNLIQATHKTTFEITRERRLTPRGDCIIAVGADKSVADLSREFKELARKEDAEITIVIECGGEKEVIKAHGDPRLTFTHPSDMVVRKSRYVCSRTLAVKADKAAWDISRKLVRELRNPVKKVKITLIVRNP